MDPQEYSINKGEIMRELDIGTKFYTIVSAVDEPDFGANHVYEIRETNSKTSLNLFSKIVFQKGPIKENGVNGCHNKDLIAIVLDRLQGFQETEFKCRENALAITKLEEALMWLNKRTQNRKKKGVEGTSKI